MNPLRSVGARLSLALAAVVAGALGAVYLFVAPPLERNLVHAKLSQLQRVAPSLRERLLHDPIGINDPDFVSNAASAANARVVLFSILAPSPAALQAVDDSRQGASSSDVESDPIALRAATTLEAQHGTVSRGDERYAEVAEPLDDTGYVLLLSASLHDTLGSVHLVQHRLVIAGIAALLASLLVGFGGAAMFARRIRRLERAADRIAGGRFDEPVEDPTSDELGELARAFDRMRLPGDLLDLSRLDAGRLRVEHEPIQLAEVARALVDEFQGVARTGDRLLELELDGAAPVLGDDERALRIGRALVENALRHTPRGTRVVVRAGGGDRPVLEVTDDGPGIPAGELARVFERFYRGDGSLASGRGLGLAIGRGAGWIGDGATDTLVVPSPAQPRAVSAQTIAGSTAKPLIGNAFDPAKLYARRGAGVVTIYAFFGNQQAATEAQQGSGFVVSKRGYILTSSHVITNAGEGNDVSPAGHVYVEFSDRDRVTARVVGWDVFDDVGVLKVDPRAHVLAPVPLGDSSRVVVGEPVAAIGSPFGNADSLATGVVSAVHRSIS